MLELSPTITRQYIDAVATFEAYEDARREARQVRGGMYWHKGPASAPDAAYLVRTTASGSEKSLGPRSPETETIYASFHHRKKQAEGRLAGLQSALGVHQRMNRALRVGRVLPLVVEILNRLDGTDLSEHFRVVGTHALYAYEAAAGIRFDEGAVATQDIDLLWDIRKRVSFATTLAKVDGSMLSVLRKVDPTFRLKDSQRYTAVNQVGFEVDVLRRMRAEDDPHPVQLSDNEEDFWVTQAPRAQALLDSTPFSAVIVATNGTMARMNTVEPATFVRFKRWMSELPDRDPLKRRRDSLQAAQVALALKEYLPHLSQA